MTVRNLPHRADTFHEAQSLVEQVKNWFRQESSGIGVPSDDDVWAYITATWREIPTEAAEKLMHEAYRQIEHEKRYPPNHGHEWLTRNKEPLEVLAEVGEAVYGDLWMNQLGPALRRHCPEGEAFELKDFRRWLIRLQPIPAWIGEAAQKVLAEGMADMRKRLETAGRLASEMAAYPAWTLTPSEEPVSPTQHWQILPRAPEGHHWRDNSDYDSETPSPSFHLHRDADDEMVGEVYQMWGRDKAGRETPGRWRWHCKTSDWRQVDDSFEAAAANLVEEVAKEIGRQAKP